jgi:quercetin 2,3-dioxygenase
MRSLILHRAELGFPWPTSDPFLFCVHHVDEYPAGNEQLGPAASLAGRDLGQDFAGKDGWRMYHGRVVPGFPQHPHRGFETVTIVRRGLIDHSDSLGAAARFGAGDVQWLTAGAGIVHSEMFPLLARDRPNPVELFQIWLNLPRAEKMAPPHFSMLWSRDIPVLTLRDESGRTAKITKIAGRLQPGKLGTSDEPAAPPPPPHSWASRPDSDVAIFSIQLQSQARCTLPAASHPDTVRTLYFFRGPTLHLGTEPLTSPVAVTVRSDVELPLQAGDEAVDLLLLQGRPIGEPVVSYGPFVMNSRSEIQQAFLDYQRTRFGGWPWPSDDPVHGTDPTRFARHADGRAEKRPSDETS